MAFDPKTLRPGDILNGDDDHYTWFVNSVDTEGAWIELLCKPTVWPPCRRRPTTVTCYSTLAGHGCRLPFSNPKYWYNRTKVGSLPGLVNQRSLRIET